jgi:predicted MFS family arabinose efflux permease
MSQTERRRIVPLVSALGVVQILSWGTLYYSTAVLAKPVATSLGLSDADLLTAFGVSLLLSGILAPLAGRWVDRFGGRMVMTAGSILAAVSFLILATAGNVIQVYGGWLVAGLAMTAALYDVAFPSLRRLYPDADYRKAVTLLTIFGGVASTVFWPVSDLLNHLVGWRWTYGIFAFLHVGGVFVHLCSPDHRNRVNEENPDSRPSKQPMFRDPRFLLLAIGFACIAFASSAVSTFVVRSLSENGLDRGMALFVASLIGPMQVLGRLLEYGLARHVGIQRMGTVSYALFVVALLVLCVVGSSPVLGVVFAVVYGFANGTMSIIRGTVPVFLLRHIPPGQLLGGLALPSAFTRAAAPAAFAFLAVVGSGNTVPLTLCVGIAVLGLGSYWAALAVKPRPLVPGADSAEAP